MSSELKPDYVISNHQIDKFWDDGFIFLKEVLNKDEIKYYGNIIRETATNRIEKNNLEPVAEGAFYQTLNLRFDSLDMMKFCLAERFGGIVAQLLKVDSVRIYHEQILFKPPGGNLTMWHQDQFYWPLDSNLVVGMWMPIVDCTSEMGMLRYVKGSHKYGDQNGDVISKRSHSIFDSFIKRKNLKIVEMKSCNAGDCTFHFGWTAHGAGKNVSEKMREAMIVSYFADGTRVGELYNSARINDAKYFLGGKNPGEIADSDLNKIVYKKNLNKIETL